MYRNIYNNKTNCKDATFYSAATFLGHQNIFSMTNQAQHSARRKIQNRPYSQQAINENEGLISTLAKRLTDRILAVSRESRNADVFPICGLFSLEVICQVAFNTDIAETSEDNAYNFLRAMDDSAKMLPIRAAMPFLNIAIGKHIPGFIGHTFRQFENWIGMTRHLYRQFSIKSEEDKTERYLATPLLQAQDEFLGRSLTEDEAVEEAMGIAFAGSGTTSTTLVYLLWNLSRPENQHHQARLREELRSAEPALKNLKHLPFLNAVIKETMRLNPTIISTLPRVVGTEIAIPGTDIVLPQGTKVGMQNYVHHRDSEVYPSPHTFNPDRWLGLGSTSLQEKFLTPFSVGSRNCIGQNLAWAELYLCTSSIFRRLELSATEETTAADMEMEDRFNISPRLKRLVLQVQAL